MAESIGIVGLGYVGTPLATAFSASGYRVFGFDIDQDTVERLQQDLETPVELPSTRSSLAVYEQRLEVSTDPQPLADCDVIITTVPTPLTDDSMPDMSIVETAGQTIGEHISPGTTAVLESTVFPGATRGIFAPAIEQTSGLVAGEDFDLGYSPERLTPGGDHELRNSVKPVSAADNGVRDVLEDLYSTVVEETFPAPSIESAEAAKCLENVQRDVNIALINEFAMACSAVDGLDYEDVLSVAETKWNFHRYRPGLVGGHCIPIDPYYLIYELERHGGSTPLMRQARSTNESLVEFVAGMVEEAMTERKRAGNSDHTDRILVCGLSYKPNADDLRSAANESLFEALAERGYEVVGYDPYVDETAAAETFGIDVWSSIDERVPSALLMLANHDEFTHLSLEGIVDRYPTPPAVIDVPRLFDDPTRSDIVYRRL